MKLQYLAVIFVIIILPIVLILSQYVDYQIEAVNLRHTYNTKLIDATYDSIKAYQLNTINNAVSDIPGSKIEDLEAAVKTFFNSLSTTYGYTGYNASVMKNFIPAIVFTMYDGYYIYSPFDNTLTGVQKEQDKAGGGKESYVAPEYVESTGIDGKTSYGIKPYVYYSCRYKKSSSDDFVITYTLDNYITIQGKIKGNYINEYGYLIDGIEKSGDSYTYDGVKYDKSQEEKMVENLNGKTYSYVKINGTKYYLDETKKEVFYINASGERAVQSSKSLNESVYKEYKNKIEKNNSAYEYYKAAFEFTKKVRDDLGLGDLKASNAVDDNGNKISDFGEDLIFGEDNGDNNKTGIKNDNSGDEWIQYSNSKFNEHRSAVIRYTVEKNLSAAISGYRQYNTSDTSIEYIMPKISETDWDKIENDISIITFLQGFKIGGRDYNKYCVISNNLNKEHVDENDIYLIGNDNTYHKANEEGLNTNGNTENGIWKINFERKSYKEAISDTDENYQTVYYYPLKEIGSYSSIVASSKIKYENDSQNEYTDLYRYMKDNGTNKNVKKVYYTALARERWGAYSVNNSTDIVTPKDEDIPPTPEPTPDPEPATGTESITIDKVDEDGNKINNAWFWLTDKKENLNDESKILPQYRGGTGQGTNPSGQVIFNNLVSGRTYYIQEKYTPIEYKANEQIYEFKAGEKTEIVIENEKIRKRTYR